MTEELKAFGAPFVMYDAYTNLLSIFKARGEAYMYNQYRKKAFGKKKYFKRKRRKHVVIHK